MGLLRSWNFAYKCEKHGAVSAVRYHTDALHDRNASVGYELLVLSNLAWDAGRRELKMIEHDLCLSKLDATSSLWRGPL